MDREDMAAIAAETMLLRAFMLEFLDGFASRAENRAAFVQDFIGRLHLRLDAVEQSIAAPQFAGLFEMARQQADGMAASLLG